MLHRAAVVTVLPKLELITEGGTELYVPSQSLSGRAPATHPVFFNPAARTNRDVSVAVASVTRPRTYLDALAGTGARGVRVAKEALGGSDSAQVTLVDFGLPALAVARRNVARNGLRGRCAVVHREANAYLVSRFERPEKFDAIDLDPFGTPAPFVLAATSAAADGAMVSMTATDAAVLCGVYPEVAFRRYGARAVRSDFVHETGLRILLGFAARMAGINEAGVEPVAAHSTLHYLRAFFVLRRGATKADASARSLGYVTQCNGCGSRFSGDLPARSCPGCGTRVRSAGPLWLGPMVGERVAGEAAAFAEERGWRSAADALASIRGIDRFPAFSYSPERVCSSLKIPSVSAAGVIDALSAAGFAAARQPFEDIGIKTDASYGDFVAAVRAASPEPAEAE